MVSRTRTLVNPIARVILAGVYLPSSSPLRILSSCPDAVERIYMEVKKTWATQLIFGYDDANITPQENATLPSWADLFLSPDIAPGVTLSRFLERGVSFPPPKDLYCNMLPFRADNPSTIPPEYHGYIPMIEKCYTGRLTHSPILYLTIHESSVDECVPQRRPGIHVEGFRASHSHARRVEPPSWHSRANPRAKFVGGIFQASSVKNSCRMWNVQIPRNLSDALQEGCDLEHLRGALNEVAQPVMPNKNVLWWMTDATPHESLPLEPGTYRQYFRLVVDPISCWWSQHSTANRLGIQPDCRILDHNKFDEDAYIDYDRGETSTQVQCDLAEPSS